MKRPIVFITIFMCLGIMCNYYFDNIYSVILAAIGLFLFNIIICLKYSNKKHIVLYLFFILGFSLVSNKTNINLDEQHLIQGVVTNKTDNSLLVTTSTIDNKNEDINILLKNYSENVNTFDEISFTSKLIEFDKNSYEYIYYKSNNIKFKTYSNEVHLVGTTKNFHYYLNTISQSFSSIYDKIFPKNISEIVKAFVLGQNENISTKTLNLYKQGGIIHIIALSGLHIAIVCTFLMFTLNILIKDNRKNLIVIAFLIFYLILTGSSLSTTRAVIMGICVLIAPLFRREKDTLASIFFAGFLILLIYPYSLFSASFILSFTSVLSIVLLTPKIKKSYNVIAVRLNSKFLLSIKLIELEYISSFLSIYLIMSVILTYYFNYFYPYSIFVNLIIAPFIAPLIILSIICGIVGLFSITLATFIGATVYYILAFFEFICNLFINLPHSQIHIGKPSLFFIILYLITIYIIFFYKNKKTAPLLIILILFISTNVINNNIYRIDIINNDNECVFINHKGSVMIETKTDSIYNIEKYILNSQSKNISSIVTDSIDETIFLNDNNLLKDVYICEGNKLIDDLINNDIKCNVVKNNEKFTIKSDSYLIDDNNVYLQTKNFSFSNIKDYTDVLCVDVQNNVQNINGYDIIVNEQDEIIENKSFNKRSIYFIKDKIIIRWLWNLKLIMKLKTD